MGLGFSFAAPVLRFVFFMRKIAASQFLVILPKTSFVSVINSLRIRTFIRPRSRTFRGSIPGLGSGIVNFKKTRPDSVSFTKKTRHSKHPGHS